MPLQDLPTNTPVFVHQIDLSSTQLQKEMSGSFYLDEVIITDRAVTGKGICLFFPVNVVVTESYHRTIEWPGLKRTTMIIEFQPPAMCRVTNQQTRLPRATSSLALNASRDGASTTWVFPGSFIQSFNDGAS